MIRQRDRRGTSILPDMKYDGNIWCLLSEVPDSLTIHQVMSNKHAQTHTCNIMRLEEKKTHIRLPVTALKHCELHSTPPPSTRLRVRWTAVNANAGPASPPNITAAIIHPSASLLLPCSLSWFTCCMWEKNRTAPLQQCQHSRCLVWERKESQAPRGQREEGPWGSADRGQGDAPGGKRPRRWWSSSNPLGEEAEKRNSKERGVKEG